MLLLSLFRFPNQLVYVYYEDKAQKMAVIPLAYSHAAINEYRLSSHVV
jgi:hypothetical protein